MKVIIIGADAARMTAAMEIVRSSPGTEILVLEREVMGSAASYILLMGVLLGPRSSLRGMYGYFGIIWS